MKKIDRSIVLGTLNVADHRPIYAGIYRQLLLRYSLRRTKASKIPGNTGASVHWIMATILHCVKPSYISDIISSYPSLDPADLSRKKKRSWNYASSHTL